jgi:hypothetical protein
MAGLMIRLNEAELLRAGMPRESVVALREIVKVIGSGFSSGDLGDIEGLILTASRESADTANLRADVARLSERVSRLANMTAIENRLSQLEHRTAAL